MQMEEDDDENEKKLEKRTQMNTAEIKKNKTMQMTPQNLHKELEWKPMRAYMHSQARYQLEKLDENSDFSRWKHTHPQVIS